MLRYPFGILKSFFKALWYIIFGIAFWTLGKLKRKTPSKYIILEGQLGVPAFKLAQEQVIKISSLRPWDWVWQTWVWIFILPLSTCVTLDKLLNLSEPQFPSLQNGDSDSIHLRELLRGWSEIKDSQSAQTQLVVSTLSSLAIWMISRGWMVPKRNGKKNLGKLKFQWWKWDVWCLWGLHN